VCECVCVNEGTVSDGLLADVRAVAGYEGLLHHVGQGKGGQDSQA